MKLFIFIKTIIISFYIFKIVFCSDGKPIKVMPVRSWSREENMEWLLKCIKNKTYFNSFQDQSQIKNIYLCAVERADVEALRILSVSSFVIKNTDRFYGNNDTLLHVAARRGNKDVVEAVLDCELSENIKNEDGQTAMQVALDWQHHDVAEMIHQASRKKNK
jgi:hypothetical protein